MKEPLSKTGNHSRKIPRVSVVIPVNKQDSPRLFRCLECLANQDYEEDYEVILGIDENVPIDADSLKRLPLIRWKRYRSGLGPGGARNAAMTLARGEFFLFTDADCRPGRNWMRLMVQTLLQRNGTPVRGWIQTGNKWKAVERASDFAERGIGKPRKSILVPGWTGGNMGCGRQWYDGGARFAETVYGGEEGFFLSQFRTNGEKALFCPHAEVIHDNPMNVRSAYARMCRIGFGSGFCRRRASLRGSFFARHPWTALLIVPARFILTAWRMRFCTLHSNLEFFALSPIVLLFWIAYARGFARGARYFVKENGNDTAYP